MVVWSYRVRRYTSMSGVPSLLFKYLESSMYKYELSSKIIIMFKNNNNKSKLRVRPYQK